MKEGQILDIEVLFHSVEGHTLKAVQMNSLTRNFAENLESEKPQEFGDTSSYTKVYFGKLNGEYVTVEKFWMAPPTAPRVLTIQETSTVTKVKSL